MLRPTTTRAGGVLLLATLLLTGCSASAEDVAHSRAEVRGAAEDELPRLADALDVGVVRATGRFNLYGIKTATIGYRVQVVLAGDEAVTQDELAAAVEDLGYDVTQYSEFTETVAGERRDVVLSAVADDRGEVRMTYSGPELHVPKDRWPSRDPEDLDLPSSLFVPAIPPPPGAPGSAEEIAEVRTQARAALEEELPPLVKALGVAVLRADGRFWSEDGADPVVSGYRVTVHLVGEGPASLDVLADALRDLGYDVEVESRSYGEVLEGARGDLTVSGELDDRGDIRLSYRSRDMQVPPDAWPERGREAEELDLPEELYVPGGDVEIGG
ncbi:hypothetical protein GC089_13990 [Cellulomonas sp. JZ18]|uniref:hypothetical protein n=1 Tax=Cellulomonas sp. JZ18 TaxID=2654191 RepID=UPI0012D45139|nr:hypothetical protein [Cellulomonas sp. JZ18]QGQ20116.1 hypothetical protein GC089_13990 [Cellulomonas sp. JZ18]